MCPDFYSRVHMAANVVELRVFTLAHRFVGEQVWGNAHFVHHHHAGILLHVHDIVVSYDQHKINILLATNKSRKSLPRLVVTTVKKIAEEHYFLRLIVQ